MTTEIQKAIEDLRDAQEAISNTPCAGRIGADGPTLDALIALVEKSGGCYADCATSHDCQWAWRKIESAIEHLNK